MNKKPGTSKYATDKLVWGIKRKTRKHYSTEAKINSATSDATGTTGFVKGATNTVGEAVGARQGVNDRLTKLFPRQALGFK